MILISGAFSAVALIATAAHASVSRFPYASWTLTNSSLSLPGPGSFEFTVGQTLSVLAVPPGGTSALEELPDGTGSLNATTMTLQGGNNNRRGLTWYSTVADDASPISIDWAYTNAPGGDTDGWDAAGWVLNGVFTVLAVNAGSPASGTLTFSVNAGDTYGFGFATADGDYGPGTATFTNFVPAPGAITLLAMAGLPGSRRRRA